MKKIIGIITSIIIIVAVILIIVIINNNNNNLKISDISNIKDIDYIEYSDNLYYLNPINTSEKIFNNYNIISEFLKNKYPSLKFIVNSDSNGNEIITTFILYQIIDQALVENTLLTINIENGKVVNFDDSNVKDNFINSNIKAIINVKKNDIKQEALELVRSNVSNVEDNLKGNCYLKYNKQNGFFYLVTFNNNSYVSFDVNTGKVLKVYFFNGIYD